MELGLANGVYIVTGGATGIGAGITAKLREYGARVHIFQPENCDVRDPAAVEKATQEVFAREGRLDGLVNNAGVTGKAALAPALSASVEHSQNVLATNLLGPFYCAQSAARLWVAAGQSGVIVNISSVGAFAAQEHAALYCASKAALVSLTRSLALEWAPYGIRVNAVAPGDILTPTNRDIVEDLSAGGASGLYLRRTPQGRRGSPEEIGDTVAFLLSPRSSFTTGATLTVDGGLLTY